MLINFFINKQIGVLTFSSPMFSSKAIWFDIMWIKLSDSFIIELNPTIVRLLYITEVVTKVCGTIVKYNSLENVIILRRLSCAFLIVNGVRVYIKLLGEFKPSVQFFIFKLIVIELHSFQMDDEIIGHFCQKCTFCYIWFLFACITLIVWNDFSMYKLFERFLNAFDSFDLKW